MAKKVGSEAGATRELKPVMVRLELHHHELLSNHAHARKVPPAALARAVLAGWLETQPDPGLPPPPLDALGPRAAQLLASLTRCAGNCTQVLAWAQRLGAAGVGAPAPAYTALVDVIGAARSWAESLGLQVKAGQVQEDQAAQHLARLAAGGGEELNTLARALNSGEAAPAAAWLSVAKRLREMASGG